MPQRNVTSKNPPTQKCQIDVSCGKLGMDVSPKVRRKLYKEIVKEKDRVICEEKEIDN